VVQAQNANLNMAAKQEVKVDSVDGKVALSANKKITLICGGSYIKISEEGIELGTQDNVYLKCNVMQKMGAHNMSITNNLADEVKCQNTQNQQANDQQATIDIE
jgi:type VI secretion system secreted protein VgrG